MVKGIRCCGGRMERTDFCLKVWMVDDWWRDVGEELDGAV